MALIGEMRTCSLTGEHRMNDLRCMLLITLTYTCMPYSICISVFQWLNHTFLGYFDEWEAEISSMTTLKKKQKAAMQLSRETLEGLKITGI